MSVMETISKLKSERDTVATAMSTAVESAAAETRDLSDVEKASQAEMEKRIAVIDDQLVRLVKGHQASMAIGDVMAAEVRADRAQEHATEQVTETRTLGQMFAESTETRAWAGRGQSPVIEVETRALITTTTPGGLSGKHAIPGNVSFGRSPLFDAISKIPVSGDSVRYPVWGAADGWTAKKVAEGADKPEAAGDFELKDFPLATWAHWKKMSRQFRADEPYLAALVDQQLLAGVRRAAEKDAVAAAVGTTTAVVTGADLLAAVRVAAAQVEASGEGVATHVLLNPADSATIDISVMATGNLGPIANVGAWGLTPITSSAVTAGTAIVFDISALVALVRTGVELYMTDSDISGAGATAKSDFRANILTVLAEARGAVLLQDPRLVVPAKKA